MSYPQRNLLTFKCAAAIAIGLVVKPGADKEHAIVSAAATSKNFGINQTEATVAEDPIEIALPGGGGLAKLGGTVSFGDFLTADSAGKLVATTTAGNYVVAQALQDGVANDLIAVNVVSFLI